MFVVLLRFGDNRDAAGEHVRGHQAWIERGFDDGVFLLVGSIQPGLGGAVLAAATSRDDLEARVADDPFVVHDIVRSEIIEVAAGRSDDRLRFLLDGSPA